MQQYLLQTLVYADKLFVSVLRAFVSRTDIRNQFNEKPSRAEKQTFNEWLEREARICNEMSEEEAGIEDLD